MTRLNRGCAGGGIFIIASAALAAPQYHATPIDLGPNYNFLTAIAINSSGNALVTAKGPGATDQFDEYIWAANQTSSYIPWVGRFNLGPRGLTNDNTVIAGPCVGNASGFTILTGAPQYPRLDGDALAINNRHQVVGHFLDGAGEWDAPGYVYSDLGTAGGAVAEATVINDVGIIAGIYGEALADFTQPTFPFVLDHGNLIHLPSLPGSVTGAAVPLAMNDAGLIVGSAQGSLSNSVPVYWQNDQLFTLTLPDGRISGSALAVNSSGDIVGYSSDNAVLWQDGTYYDLNDLLDNPDGNILIEARGINDSGQIIANALDDDGHERAYLLTPITVPEPASITTLRASGLLLFSRRSARRRVRS